jgi:hypothetical protein
VITFAESRATVTKKMRRIARMLDKISDPSVHDNFWECIDEFDDLEDWIRQLEGDYREARAVTAYTKDGSSG